MPSNNIITAPPRHQPSRYRKELAFGSIGWNIITPAGEILCWLSDAAVADRVLKHLNRELS